MPTHRVLRRVVASVIVAASSLAAAGPAVAGQAPGGHPQIFTTSQSAATVSPLGVIRSIPQLPHHGWAPIVSPDGRWVAYTRDVGAYVMRMDGTGNRRLMAGHALPLAWAPDSRSVLTVGMGRPLTVVHVADGSFRHLEKANDWGTYAATFSPDGRYILVSDVYGWRLLQTRDGKRRHFVASPCVDSEHLAWSPDGRRIATLCAGDDVQGTWVEVLTIATGRALKVGNRSTGVPFWLRGGVLVAEQYGKPRQPVELRTYDSAGHRIAAVRLNSWTDVVGVAL